MKTEIRDIKKIVRDLKGSYPKLSDYELLNLAIQLQRNEILENGFVVSTNDKNPVGLEAIAIALGYENKGR